MNTTRIVRRFLADTKRLDLAWVDGLRKDFLTLLKNLPRVHDYKTAHELRAALTVFRTHFDELFFEHFLNYDLKNHHSEISEGDSKWFEKKLRKTGWDFSIELSVPIGFADEYNGEEGRFAKFEQEYPAWKARIQRKAQTFWKDLKEFIEYYQRNTEREGIDVYVPSTDKTELEGFQLIMHGFKPGNKYDEEALGVIKEGLRKYRERATKVAPILLQKQRPITMEFKLELDKGGTYNKSTGMVTFYAMSTINKGPDWVVHALAHEMGHHLFETYLSKEATDLWIATIKGDYGELDIQELLNKWPGTTWAWEFPDVMGKTDPILALQVDAVSHAEGYRKELQTKEDYQKLLDSGQRTITVPKTPITGYANKNPEEAFCETIGMLIAHGPQAVHEKVRWWLETVMPGGVKVASYDRCRPRRVV